MAKAFFEKFTHVGENISTKQSIINNINMILSSGGLLDADDPNRHKKALTEQDGFLAAMSSVVEMSGDNQDQISEFQQDMIRVLTTHEPRIKQVWVVDLGSDSQRGRCQLRIAMAGEEFEQEFTFNQWHETSESGY